ncbi:hypothetical protein EDF38_1309 [Frigoribacterium sp. PhB160]|uniref:hypothetical protein n=1 Tax=Frigoribacterium sp. PhB160 TaxID=2485192 RepID=UPI000F476B53|nr:hypothetical protein [Frigoribacterium sp. PhB160]ROS62206.1 hypothetical protein EDF38_1309 [Frigoribacterium sp. PhB160]
MVYEVPASKASVDQNVFTFKIPGDRRTHKVPKLRFIKPSLMREMDAQANRIDRVYALLEHYVPGVVDKFESLDQLEALYENWAKESGVSVGESSASSES